MAKKGNNNLYFKNVGCQGQEAEQMSKRILKKRETHNYATIIKLKNKPKKKSFIK